MRSVGTTYRRVSGTSISACLSELFRFFYSLLRRTQAAQFHKTKFPQFINTKATLRLLCYCCWLLTVTICATFMQYVHKDLYSIFRLYIFFLIALAVLVFFIYSCDFTIILILICIIIIRRNLHRRLRNTRPCKYSVLLRIARAFYAML